MNICLVTAFPPSRRGLNEYGFHIARELQHNPLLSLTVLSDKLDAPAPEVAGYHVIRCWEFNRNSNPKLILREIRKINPDIVWFNIGFASYGNKGLAASLGLMTPALSRLFGYETHVTLHQLMETVNLDDAGVRFKALYRFAGNVITRVLLMSNSVTVLLPAYRRLLQEKYRQGAVHARPHGILSGRPEYPDFSQRGNPHHRILAFGKWGTYKRLEPLIEAFQEVSKTFPAARLVIAGGNHPNTPGYVEGIAARHRDDERYEFTGYVPEEKIPDLFRGTTVAVMPYTSSAGASGVAHLACQYGVPVIASDISDFRQLADEEGLAIELFPTGDTAALAATLLRVLESPARQQEMALQNFSIALHMTMPRVIREYLRSFDLRQRIGRLRSISRARQLPRWLPFRSMLGRMILGERVSWKSRLPSPHVVQQDVHELVGPGVGLQRTRNPGNHEGNPGASPDEGSGTFLRTGEADTGSLMASPHLR